MIIAFGGKSGVGKDTAASLFIKKYGYTKRSFAQPLKDLCARYFDIPVEQFEDPLLKDRDFEIPVQVDTNAALDLFLMASNSILYIDWRDVKRMSLFNKICYTPRELLVFVGTDLFRNNVDEQYWTKAGVADLKEGTNYVFTDVRFPDERAALDKLGAAIVLMRRYKEDLSNHRSENSLGKDEEYTLLLDNNSTKEILYSVLDYWYTKKVL